MAYEADLDARLEAARRAVHLACEVCRVVQADLDAVREITKDDRSPVTVADYASQAVVAWSLLDSLGHLSMVAEEDASVLKRDDHASHRARVVEAVQRVWPGATEKSVLEMVDAADTSEGYSEGSPEGLIFWTLDPIDGTKGFLRGGQYAVSLAWIEAGEPTLGVLGCPNLSSDFQRPFNDPDPHGTLYFATRGGGVWESRADEPSAAPTRQRRLEPDEQEPVRVCESVESAHSDQSATSRILEHLGRSSRDLRLDSQAKYAVVARGQADAYLRMPTKKGYVERIWDHAAGALIAGEAGCFVSDIRGEGLDFRHGRGLERNLGVVCAPARLHGELIGAISTLQMDRPPGDRG